MRIVSSPVYLDASALSKLYVPEPESVVLESALLGRRDVIVSDLAVTEVASAMARRTRDRHLRLVEMRDAYRSMVDDLTEGRFLKAQLTGSVHREAERFMMNLGQRTPLRAADGLHLALAVSIRARTLVTYDRRLAAAARMAGNIELAE